MAILKFSDATYQKSTRPADDVDTEWFESLVELDDSLASRCDRARGGVCEGRSRRCTSRCRLMTAVPAT